MIYIEKTHEPRNLIKYRKTTGAHFDGLPKDLKDELRESLLKEQGKYVEYVGVYRWFVKRYMRKCSGGNNNNVRSRLR